MKKLIVAILVVVMIPVFALAEIDLSSLTFAQLMTLRNELNAEIMSRPEWKEVEVPAGNWRIGEDIPEGTYCLTPKEFSAIQVWRENHMDYGDDRLGLLFNQFVYADSPIGSLQLKAGWLLHISNPVIFTPKQGLGF